MVRIFQDDVACSGVGDDLLEISQGDIFINGNELAGRIYGQDLAMVAVSESGTI